jgi:DNA-binding IclR family transcriptional regulator
MKIKGDAQNTGSVERVFRILEAFESTRRPLSSSEICVFLKCPRSSAAALLRTLLDLQIVSIDRRTNTYFPTAKLAQIAAWHTDGLIVSELMKRKLRDLSDEVEETVVLTMPTDLNLEVVHVEQGRRPITLVVKPGQLFPIWGSAVGSAYLSTIPLSAVRSMQARASRLGGEFAPDLGFNLQEHLAPVRKLGYSAVAGAVDVSLMALAMPFHNILGPKTLVLSVGGPTDRVKEAMPKIIIAMRKVTEALR